MMYLGTPDSFTQTNFTPIVDMHYTTVAGFVNDQWKIHAKGLHELTLMLGARIEHLGPWTDKHNNGLATFSPTLYKQACTESIGSPVSCAPTTDYPGIVWHGTQSSISNSVNSPQSIYFSPRVGMAWDILGHGNTVLHGGWGVYRHQEEFAPYAAAAATAQGYKTTYLQQQWNFDGVDQQSPINPSDFNVNVLSTTDTERPVIYQYNGTISQRINTTRFKNVFANSLVEVAYVGTTMQHLSSFNQGSSYNEASDQNLIPAGYMFGDQSTNGFCLCNLPGKFECGQHRCADDGGAGLLPAVSVLSAHLHAEPPLLRQLQRTADKLEQVGRMAAVRGELHLLEDAGDRGLLQQPDRRSGEPAQRLQPRAVRSHERLQRALRGRFRQALRGRQQAAKAGRERMAGIRHRALSERHRYSLRAGRELRLRVRIVAGAAGVHGAAGHLDVDYSGLRATVQHSAG